MDNYKYAKAFERLAIKIVEECFNCKLDYSKSHTTQTTRDFGIDSVIFFEDRTINTSTIEAKLRKSDYTLSLKDIASSIIFFLVRKGDEHFIVSNVYITEGTIETLNLLSLQTQSPIYYIDGEETKNALIKLQAKLSDPEETKLAKLLITNFKKLKKPQRTNLAPKSPKTFNYPEKIELLNSREKLLSDLLESIKKQYKIIIVRGTFGTGKKLLLQCLNKALEKSIYRTITIDAYENNTIDRFCYELTRQVLGLDLKDILYMLTESEIEELKQGLTEIETEGFSNIVQIFNKSQLSKETALYLAKVYLNSIFEKCKNLRYIIEIANFSYTSQEVYDFIKNFSVDSPENVITLLVSEEDIAATNYDFSVRYKKLYLHLINEIKVKNLSFEESELYLKSLIPEINDCVVKQIYNYTKGTPLLLNLVAKELQKRVLVNNEIVSECLSVVTTYLNRDFIQTLEKNSYALKFFFVLYLYSFNMKKIIWQRIKDSDEFDEEQIRTFELTCIEKLQLIEVQGINYNLKTAYLYDSIDQFFEKNAELFCDYAWQVKDIIFADEITTLTKIKVLYYCNNPEIISEYEKSKQLWMYKSNISWKMNSLKYVCMYLLQQHSEDIEDFLTAQKYYLEYLHIKNYYGIFEQTIQEKVNDIKDILESNFSGISNEYKSGVADALADYYIYQYYFYRKCSKFSDILAILESVIKDEWYEYASTIKKIKIRRFIALLHKTHGNRGTFLDILEKTFVDYNTDSYAKLIYWANKAAMHYTEDPSTAFNYIEKCELEIFKNNYPDEIELYLWVYTDNGIVAFYNGDILAAKEIGQKVLINSERINYLENMARCHNLLGALALKEGNIKEAKKHFFSAFTLCIDEKSEAFFHFAVNYLMTNNNFDETVVQFIMDYVKSQKNRLLNIFATEKLETCRWFVTLCAFSQYLLEFAPILQKELEIVYEDSLKSISSSKLTNYVVAERLIVLF